LDEEKSKCAGLAQEKYFGSAQFAMAGKSRKQQQCTKEVY
jgi:hypothetical protein